MADQTTDLHIPDETDERMVDFCELVQDEVENRISLIEPEIGEGLGWFALDIPLTIAGEEFDSELEIELSENGVRIIVAEIPCDRPVDESRREVLDENATILHKTDDEFLYEYHSGEQVDWLLAQLEDVHSRVFQ